MTLDDLLMIVEGSDQQYMAVHPTMLTALVKIALDWDKRTQLHGCSRVHAECWAHRQGGPMCCCPCHALRAALNAALEGTR